MALATTGVLLLASCGEPLILPPNEDSLDPFVRNAIGSAAMEAKRNPSDSEARRRLCMVYEANDLFEVADRCYEQVLAMEPSSAKSWFRLARTRERQGRIEDAIEAMQTSIAHESSFAPSQWLVGLWLTDVGRLEDAARSIEEAARIDPEDRSVWFATARLQLARDEPAEAIETIRSHQLVSGENEAYGRLLLARALRAVGEIEKARLLMNMAESSKVVWREAWSAELRPLRTGRAHIARATGRLLAEGRLEEARRLLDRLVEVDPDDHRTLTLQSQYLLKTGEGDRALAVLLEALEKQPNRQVLQLNTAIVSLSLSGERPELLTSAIDHARTAVELQPDSGEAHQILAMALLQQGSFEEGLSVLTKAKELGSVKATDLQHLANALAAKNHPEIAERISAMIDAGVDRPR